MKTIFLFLTLSLLCCELGGSQFCESGKAPWGVDATIKYEKTESEKPEMQTRTLGQKSCRSMIRFFQIYISPIDGPRSSYYPTSSQYTLEAIQKWGVLTGIAMGCDRLMRENGEMWIYDTTDQHGMKRKLDPVR